MKRLFVSATVRFSVQGGRYERFLSDCLAAGIPLNGVEPCGEGVRAWAPARAYKRLRPLARRHRTRLRVLERRGLWFRLRPLRRRWGLAVGTMVFCLLLWGMQQLVWAIDCQGLDPARQQTARALLAEAGLWPGALVTRELLERGEQALLDWDELAWASLSFSQGRLRVEAAPALDTLSVEGNDPVDLVAAADGVILSVNAQEGFVCKTAGQTVARGEVLIAARQADRNEVLRTAHPHGQVIARVTRTFTCEQPLMYQVEAPTGNLKSAYTLQTFWGSLSLGGQELPSGGEIRTYHRQLSLLGFPLPATLRETVWVERGMVEQALSRETARQFARLACLRALYEAFPDAELRTSTEEENWEGNVLRYSLTLCFDADIARPADVEEP